MNIKYIDLFAGIGGFRIAANQSFKENNISGQCVFSSEIDASAREEYHANFQEYPSGDITKIDARLIPDHDLLFAGFPCQPFSIIGDGKGFADTRGTLFFDISRILDEKRPMAFVLENVKRLVSHNGGETLEHILQTLRNLGYFVDFKVLNAMDYGLPQKRERVFIVGFHKPMAYFWPSKHNLMKSLSEILEKKVSKKHFASEQIVEKRKKHHSPSQTPSIWHENKSGNISSHPFSCALRAGASYNYLLVNGERRLTPREMLRLQGFPDDFKVVVPDAQIRKQAGNSVPVNAVKAVIDALIPHMKAEVQLSLVSESAKQYRRKNVRRVA
jgi:DNA (cytosine-5)-methyltransferase 1